MKTLIKVAVIGCLIGVCVVAAAQPERSAPFPEGSPGAMGPGQMPGGMGGMGPGQMPGDMGGMGPGQMPGDMGPNPMEGRRAAELVQTLIIARLSEELGLNDEQTVLLVRRLKEFREQTTELKKKRQELIEGLKKSIAAGEGDKVIEEKLNALTANDTEAVEQKRAMIDKVGADLTVTQRAKLYVALSDFEQDMRRMIQRAREEARGGQYGGGARGGQYGGGGGQGPLLGPGRFRQQFGQPEGRMPSGGMGPGPGGSPQGPIPGQEPGPPPQVPSQPEPEPAE